MINNSFPAFILSLFDTGYIVLKGLNAHKITVIGFDHNSAMPGFKTTLGKTYLCPSPINHPLELIDFLCAKAKLYSQKPVLYPASDLYVHFLAEYQTLLKEHFLFILPEKKITDIMLSKNDQTQYMHHYGVNIPKQMTLAAHSNNPTLKLGLEYPVLIKPLQNHLWQQCFPSKVLIIQNEQELKNCHQKLKEKNIDVLIQEIIPGPDSNHFEVSHYISQSGKIWGPFIMRKLRQFPVYYGTACAGVSIENRDLEVLTHHLLKQTKLVGFVNSEFKWDPLSSKYVFIESNLRVWQQIDLSLKCGLDLALIQYLDLTGQKINLRNKYQIGLTWIDPIYDFYSFLWLWGQKKISIKEWIKTWSNVKSYGLFSLGDIKVCLKTITIRRVLSIIKYICTQVMNRLILFFNPKTSEKSPPRK